MNKLYVIGGSPRCGKTIILNDVIKKEPMIAVSSDAIRSGVRYLNKNGRINESEKMIEDELPWELLIGLIGRYDRQNVSIVVEGVVFTPERVRSLKLKNLELKAVFVGFTTDEFIEQIIEYGKQTKDWVYDSIVENDGSEDVIKKTLADEQKKNLELKARALKYGYKFFDIEVDSFDVYKNKVADYLLS